MTRQILITAIAALAVLLGVMVANGQVCGPEGCSVGAFGRARISANGDTVLRGGLGGASTWRAATPRQTVQSLEPAVVQTICRSGGTTKYGTGTVIAVRKSRPRVGAVLTCAHTLQAGGEVTIRYQGTIFPAEIVDQDGTLDLALLLFPAPLQCYYLPLASEDPQPGISLVWEGFTSNGPVRFTGPVRGYVGSLLRMRGGVRDGMSGGPIFSRSRGLVSVVTTGYGRTAVEVTYIEGPALSWVRHFLRRGRYAWVLQGCVTPAVEPPQDAEDADTAPPIPVPDSPSCCDELRELIQLNAAAIAALTLTASTPGPQGIQGERGETGEQGIQGERGESGQAFDVDALTEEDILALAVRLPLVRLQTVTTEGVVIQEASAPLGEPVRLRLVPVGR